MTIRLALYNDNLLLIVLFVKCLFFYYFWNVRGTSHTSGKDSVYYLGWVSEAEDGMEEHRLTLTAAQPGIYQLDVCHLHDSAGFFRYTRPGSKNKLSQ